jgi:hypothetical protein
METVLQGRSCGFYVGTAIRWPPRAGPFAGLLAGPFAGPFAEPFAGLFAPIRSRPLSARPEKRAPAAPIRGVDAAPRRRAGAPQRLD